MTLSPGHFALYTKVKPALTAGDYRFRAKQNLNATGPHSPLTSDGMPVNGLATHVRVTSPRYVLPPDQVLSTFPPAGTQGNYGSRLPQVVIKRRTLPWERAVTGAPEDTPWLALVVFAEGEADFLPSQPVAQCVSAGRSLAGVAETQNGSCLEISTSMVAKIMPTQLDVPLLAHARQVDINDTELMMGDDDGFLAVVIANRLPLSGRSPDGKTELPVMYHACLINLEEQFDLLIPKAPEPRLRTDHFVLDAAMRYVSSVEFDHATMDTTAIGHEVKAHALPKATAAYTALESEGTVAPYSGTGHWSSIGVANSVANVAGMHPFVLGEVIDPKLRFPVLLHWTFTSFGSDTFESYMRSVDNGLIGTVGAKPKPVEGRAPLESVETGHVGIDQRTRRGDTVRAWYRGPLLPHPADQVSARLPLAHTADQLRAVIPDGREDLSLAAAFEIGRLLALSQPSLVNALLHWRQGGYQAARSEALWSSFLGKFILAGTKFDVGVALGTEMARGLVAAVTNDPLATVGPPHPMLTAGTPMNFEGDALDIVTQGFALQSVAGRPLATVFRELQQTKVPISDLKAAAPAVSHVLGDVRLNRVADIATELKGLQITDLESGKGGGNR